MKLVVNRYYHRPGKEDRKVSDRPFRTVFAADRHTVAVFHTERTEVLRQFEDPRVSFTIRQRGPLRLVDGKTGAVGKTTGGNFKHLGKCWPFTGEVGAAKLFKKIPGTWSVL